MTVLSTRPAELVRASERAVPPRPLPAWPVLILFYGFPVIWVLGALQFVPFALAMVMAAYMVTRGRIMVPPPVWFLVALVVWSLASVSQLPEVEALVGFALRWGNMLAALILLLYVVNARERLGERALIGGLVTVWATTVLLGALSLLIPEVRVTTPLGQLMPGSLTANELVRDFVFPPMAEIQFPYGAPEPYIRPAAPFPYANSWGVAYVLLTPIALAQLTIARRWWSRALIIGGLVLSLVPAVASSNRAMFAGVGLALLYAVIRLGLSGRIKTAVISLGIFGLAALWFVLGGAAAAILGRQEYSDSTGGRMELYRSTWAASLQQPFLGHGAPRLEESVGVYMGTQGYLWMILFSYGLVGLALFVAYLWSSMIWSAQTTTAAGILLHSVSVAASVVFVVYSFDIMQTCVLVTVLAMLMRARIIRTHG